MSFDFDDENGRTSRQTQQSQDEYYDNVDLDFYSRAWDEWNVSPGTPSSGAGRTRNPARPGKDPLSDLDDDELDAFVRLRRWGKGPVYAAAEELGLKDINDIETMDQVSDWLKENYGNLFGDKEEEEEREPYVPTPYERTELDMGDFKPPEEMRIRKSTRTVGTTPIKTNQLTIR